MPTPSPRPLSLNVLQIQSPCDADWHAMRGSTARRHCADCDLHVHDLAAMPRRKAENLLALSQHQRVCARVTRDAQGQVVTRDRWRTARNRFAAAAGLALSMIGLTGCGDRTNGAARAPQLTPVAGGIGIAQAPCELPEVIGAIVAQPPVIVPSPTRGSITVMDTIAVPADP